MYKRIYLGILLVWSVFHYGQIVLNSPPAPNTEKSDPHSIRLLQGFSFNSTNGTFRAYIGTSSSGNNPYTPVNPNYSTNINSNENYIYTREYLVPTTTSDGSLPQIQSIQFFDGLGRPKQTVNIKSTPSGKDLVTHIPYDGFGRQVDSWLPVPMSSLNGNIQIDVESSTNAYYQSNNINDTYPFLHKNLENSPLDRILSQKNPGAAWQNKPVNFEYDANVDGEVKKYIATFNYTTFESSITLSTAGYGAAQLYKNTVTDEDGNKTIEFKNGQGQVVLVRKVLSPTENADTYYVYNDYNQLAYVIPPLAVTANSVDDSTLNNLCYQYKYDGRNRLVEKKLPGKGWEHMVYDKADRLIFTQDAILRTEGKWLFTKYDQFGRVIYTGIILAAPRSSLQNTADNYIVTDSRSSTGFSKNGIQVYYTNVLFNEIHTLLSVNYYDTYPSYSFNPSFPSSILGQAVLTDNSTGNNISTKSLSVMTLVKNIEDDNWTRNYTYYDTKGRTIGTYSINHLGGYTKTENLLKFSGKPDYTYTYHKRTTNDTELNIKETFEYDHQERVVRQWHQVNGGAQELLAENLYNDLGQLQTKNVGNTTGSPLQSVNYAYNIRGWLTKVNQLSDLANKLFAYELRYNNPDNQFGGATTGKYNGNISQVSWITQNDAVLRNYSYEYDALNRLKEGRFWDAMNLDRGEYFEQLTYDMNGNIKTLLRRGRQFPGYTAPEVMDDLEYHYENGELSNKLSYLKEKGTGNAQSGYPLSSGITGSVIGYDLNGNMTTQADKGLSSIVYNYLNLPKQIISPQGNTLYTYRTDGVKIKKILGTKTTDYLGGFQYENDILKFIPTSEGYYNFENNKYIYNYTDHLGNTRLSYTKNGSGAEIIEENNYYPFGLKHEGYNQLLGNPAYQYKYNGKELQESGMYDYGARFYMPDIGRWGVVDPLAEKMTRHSPYNYAFNNPIRFIDPDGRSGKDWVKGGRDDTWHYRSDITSPEEAADAGYTSYANGRGDDNSSYTTPLSRNGINTGVEQNVVLGEGGNYTVDGESFIAKDEAPYVSSAEVDKLGKALTAQLYVPAFIMSGGSGSVVMDYLTGAALRGATDYSTQAYYKGSENVDKRQLFINTFVGGGNSLQSMGKIALTNLSLNTANNFGTSFVNGTGSQDAAINTAKIFTGALGTATGMVGGNTFTNTLLPSIYMNGTDKILNDANDRYNRKNQVKK